MFANKLSWLTWNLNSNVFLRFKCQNRQGFRMFFFIANEWTFTHVGQTKSCQSKPDHIGLICWTTCCPIYAGLNRCISHIFSYFIFFVLCSPFKACRVFCLLCGWQSITYSFEDFDQNNPDLQFKLNVLPK